jgi:hypothetical protein
MCEPEIFGPGEIYEEPTRSLGPLARMLAISAISAGVLALAGVVWYAYQQGIRSGAEEAAPIVRASDVPIKRVPTDRGGLDVPHQDKLVFGRLAPGQIQEPVERLLPPPEEPAERAPSPVAKAAPTETLAETNPETPAPPAQIPAEAPAEVAAAAPTAPVAEAPATIAPPPSLPAPVVTPPPPAPPVVAAKPPAPPPVPPAAAPPAAAPSAAAPPPPAPPVAAPAAPKPTPVANAANAWRIQLAAVSSRESALVEWDRMKKRNTDLLGPLDLNVQSVKLDRGTFFRIQAGPLTGRAAASSLCGKLKSRNQDCLIVAP